MMSSLVLDRLRNPDKLAQRLEDYIGIQAGFPAFSVAEEGENGCLHYQGLVEIDITNASYAQKFKRKGYKGNAVYSTKLIPNTVNDKSRTLKYLCKGKDRDTLPSVINNTMSLTQEDIEAYHISYWMENDQLNKKHTKAEKKLSHREQFYKEFIEYCRMDPKVDVGKYKLDWIGKQFFRFSGVQPRPELTNWIKGVIFSAQTVLLRGDESELAEKAIDRWVERILF